MVHQSYFEGTGRSWPIGITGNGSASDDYSHTLYTGKYWSDRVVRAGSLRRIDLGMDLVDWRNRREPEIPLGAGRHDRDAELVFGGHRVHSLTSRKITFERYAMAPGWVLTDMGGPEADLEVRESIPRVVDAVTSQIGKPGLRFLDYTGRTVAWQPLKTDGSNV